MTKEQKTHLKIKLHPRNKNRERYDLNALIQAVPSLEMHIKPNKFGVATVDFANPIAIKLLNKALLLHYYGIKNWDFPDENLCAPIPGRADYIHYIADLLGEDNFENIPFGDHITCFDVGMGANCIYPIIGVTAYNWKFIGSDIDSKSIALAQNIIKANTSLTSKIECRLQKNANCIFKGVLDINEKIDVTFSNPPFHASLEDAQKGTRRKIKNLSGKKIKTPKLNFAGISNELIYEGGEYRFICNMVNDSKVFAKNCYWFTTLVSKRANLKRTYKLLAIVNANQVKTISMGTGNKTTQIIAWTFLSKTAQKTWRATRWKR